MVKLYGTKYKKLKIKNIDADRLNVFIVPENTEIKDIAYNVANLYFKTNKTTFHVCSDSEIFELRNHFSCHGFGNRYIYEFELNDMLVFLNKKVNSAIALRHSTKIFTEMVGVFLNRWLEVNYIQNLSDNDEGENGY